MMTNSKGSLLFTFLGSFVDNFLKGIYYCLIYLSLPVVGCFLNVSIFSKFRFVYRKPSFVFTFEYNNHQPSYAVIPTTWNHVPYKVPNKISHMCIIHTNKNYWK